MGNIKTLLGVVISVEGLAAEETVTEVGVDATVAVPLVSRSRIRLRL